MHHRIQSCDVYNTGSGGIFLSGGSKVHLINGNNVVENCKVHDYNLRNKFLWAGINVNGCGNIVSHNEVYNAEFQGIFVYGNEHIFEYNNVHDVTTNSDDTSPWYIGRDPSNRGNIVRYNYFHHRSKCPYSFCLHFLNDENNYNEQYCHDYLDLYQYTKGRYHQN